MGTIGCCGAPRPPRSTSLAGLLEAADNHPARTAKGKSARARLAYTVAAIEAARRGNPVVQQRALAGLRAIELGDAASDAAALQAQLQVMGMTAQAQSIMSTIRSVTGLVSGVSSIIAAATNDAGVREAVEWMKFFLGTRGSIPPMNDAALTSMVDFCDNTGWVSAIEGAIAAAGAIIEAAGGTGSSAADAAVGTVRVLTAALQFFGLFRTTVCGSPALARGRAVRCNAQIANSGWNAAAGSCECLPGFGPNPACWTPGTGACACIPSTSTAPTTPGSTIMLSTAQRQAILAHRSGATLTPAQRALLAPLPPGMITGATGGLDPVTLCRPGETPNPCTGICQGSFDQFNSGRWTCVGGVPTQSSSGGGGAGAVVPLAIGAAALFYLFK